jgi:arylsulfatase A
MEMDNYLLTKTNILLALSLGTLCSCANKENTEKPNIILVFADDLGYGDIGCYGQKLIQTPNIDQMAREGVLLTDFYSGSPVSAPSRYNLLTGKHAGNAYIRHNMNVLPMGQMPIKEEEVTIAEYLSKAGYVTGAFGKWSLGAPGNSGDPQKQGFDHFFGYYCQCYAHNYYPEILWRNGDTIRLKNETVPVHVNYIDYPLSYATRKVEYSEEILLDEAIGFIEDNRNNPFFLYYATQLPHSNGEAPPDERFEVPDWGIYSDSLWTPVEKGYASMVTMLDKHVGEIREKLEEMGIANNTLIIFTSDNGGTKFAARFSSNGELRGRKRDLYEGGIRVPFVACWPGRIKEGSVNDTPAITYDLLATFREIAGLEELVPTDGISLVPLLTGGETIKKRPLYWEFYEGVNAPLHALRYGNLKTIRFNFNDPDKQIVEMYDLESNPEETINLADEDPDLVSELLSMMKAEHQPYPHLRVPQR